MIAGLTEKLGRFLSIDGVTVAAIVSRDGFIVDSVGSTSLDLDALSLVVATADEMIFQSKGFVTLDAHRGKHFGEAGKKILMAPLAEEILALIVDEGKSAEWVHEKACENIAQLIDVLSPSKETVVEKKRIYRYASDRKGVGFQELDSSPGNNADILLGDGLHELVPLSENLFLNVENRLDGEWSESEYWRFLRLLYALHGVVKSSSPNNLDQLEIQTVVTQLKGVLLAVPGDYYRVLALSAQVDEAIIKRHFGVFKDLYAFEESIDADYAAILTISKAFLTLRSPQRRWVYDSAQRIENKGRKFAQQLADRRWLENGRALISKDSLKKVKTILRKETIINLLDQGKRTVGSVVLGVKKIYSGLGAKK